MAAPWKVLVLALGGGLISVLAQAQAQDVEDLRRELDALRSRLDRLENDAANEKPPAKPVPPTEDAMGHEGGENLGQAVPGTERVEPEPEAETPDVEIGGAVRFNIVYRDFVDSSEGKRGESGLDIFRLNVDGEVNNIIVSAEYRFYSYMHTIHHGWIGYEFEDESQLQFGIHQVPFGLLPYAAHNAWFGVPYYIGLGDDYDMGVKYIRQDGPWTTHVAFYKNEELNDPSNLGRYSIDLVHGDESRNEEVNSGNARLAYTFGTATDCETEVGVSAQLGHVYNAASNRRGDHWAAAAHLDSRCGRWNLQLQGARYSYNTVEPGGGNAGAVRVGAFEGSYDIAAKADIAVANLAYNISSPWPEVDQIICYNDYSRLLKDMDNGRDSEINTVGCAIGTGALFTYVDYILARNMAFFGNGSMAAGGDDKWHSRFNVNIGFYW